MFKKLKDWISRKVGDKKLVEEKDFWFQQALEFETKAVTYSDAMVALNEKHLGNTAALYNIISAILLREPDCKILISQDMLRAGQQAPEIKLSNLEDRTLVVEFSDASYNLETEQQG